MKIRALILSLLAFVCSASAEERSLARLYLSSNVKSALLSANEFRHLGNIPFSIKYRGRVSVGFVKAREDRLTVDSVISPEGLMLFKGRSRLGGPRNSKRLNVAASLFKGVFTLNFIDQGHPYTAEFNITGDSSEGLRGRIRRVPSYIRIDDGHAVSSSIPSSRYSFSDGASILASDYVLELRAVADGSLVTLLGSADAAFAHILSAVNTAETIYSSQLNAVLRVVDMQRVSNTALSATNADDLLDQFKADEDANSSSSQDLSHLFTGKELAGSTVGLAYLAVLCDFPDYSVGLTQVRNFQSLTALIFAHEVGHNLGANHDDVTPSLMSSFVSSSQDSFSALSLGEINSYLSSYGSCLAKSSSSPDPALTNYSISGVALTSKGRFLLDADAITDPSATCEVSLYGSTVKSHLEADNILGLGINIASFNASMGDVRIRIKGMPLSVSGARKIYFRVNSVCDGISGLSDIYTITLGAGGTENRNAWLSLLESKVATVISN